MSRAVIVARAQQVAEIALIVSRLAHVLAREAQDSLVSSVWERGEVRD